MYPTQTLFDNTRWHSPQIDTKLWPWPQRSKVAGVTEQDIKVKKIHKKFPNFSIQPKPFMTILDDIPHKLIPNFDLDLKGQRSQGSPNMT